MQEYNFHDLIWTKNITRDDGNAWAYMEHEVGAVFELNFSSKMGTSNARLAKKNELILLVQSVRRPNSSKKPTYLTHIVAPINDELTFDHPPGSHSIKRLVTVVAKNLRPLVKPESLDFKRPNRGKVCTIDLIIPFLRTGLVMDLPQKQRLLWELFTVKDLSVKEIISELDETLKDPNTQAEEGKELYWEGKHKYYERDRKLIEKKKKQAIQNGKLFCEVCNIDFEKKYGTIGEGFMECHHLYPIAKSGIRTNTLDDLALVCANCHRMLHKKTLDGQYLSIRELSDLLVQHAKKSSKLRISSH